MSTDELNDLWRQACANVGDRKHYNIGKWYSGTDVSSFNEQQLCQADALAGDERAQRYWTEFTRLRMTT